MYSHTHAILTGFRWSNYLNNIRTISTFRAKALRLELFCSKRRNSPYIFQVVACIPSNESVFIIIIPTTVPTLAQTVKIIPNIDLSYFTFRHESHCFHCPHEYLVFGFLVPITVFSDSFLCKFALTLLFPSQLLVQYSLLNRSVNTFLSLGLRHVIGRNCKLILFHLTRVKA